MRCAIGEMHVHMIHAAACKELGEVEGIARSLFCLGRRPIFAVVLLDEIARPFAGRFSRCARGSLKSPAAARNELARVTWRYIRGANW